MSPLITALTTAALLGAALMAGMFFAFSTFVMQALARVTPTSGIDVMQWINKTVINPWFLAAFFGTAILGVGLAIHGYRWDHPSSVLLIVGGLLYVFGTFGVTVVFNVPMNNALEALEKTSEEAATYWQHYLSRWTFWNHVRTVAAVLATAALGLAMRGV